MPRSVRIARKPGAPGSAVERTTSQRSPKLRSVREAAGHLEASIASKQAHYPDVEVIAPPDPLKLLSLREAAGYAKVSVQTVRRWIKAGYIKSYRAGRQIRIDESDLIRFLSAQ